MEIKLGQEHAEFVFEKTKGISKVYGIPSEVLTLYSTWRVNGLVVSVGNSGSVCMPVYDGYPLNKSIITGTVGGNWLNEFLGKILTERGY